MFCSSVGLSFWMKIFKIFENTFKINIFHPEVNYVIEIVLQKWRKSDKDRNSKVKREMAERGRKMGGKRKGNRSTIGWTFRIEAMITYVLRAEHRRDQIMRRRRMEREWTDRSRSNRSNSSGSNNDDGGSSDHDSVTAILIVTRNSEVVVSTSDEATGVLTWLLRTCPTAHSDCSKLGDEKYVTGKYPSWRIITTEHGPPRSRSALTHGKTAREPDTASVSVFSPP